MFFSFRVFFTTTAASFYAGKANALAPDFGKAKAAAGRIFAIIDKEPAIDNLSEKGVKPQVCSVS